MTKNGVADQVATSSKPHRRDLLLSQLGEVLRLRQTEIEDGLATPTGEKDLSAITEGCRFAVANYLYQFEVWCRRCSRLCPHMTKRMQLFDLLAVTVFLRTVYKKVENVPEYLRKPFHIVCQWLPDIIDTMVEDREAHVEIQRRFNARFRDIRTLGKHAFALLDNYHINKKRQGAGLKPIKLHKNLLGNPFVSIHSRPNLADQDYEGIVNHVVLLIQGAHELALVVRSVASRHTPALVPVVQSWVSQLENLERMLERKVGLFRYVDHIDVRNELENVANFATCFHPADDSGR